MLFDIALALAKSPTNCESDQEESPRNINCLKLNPLEMLTPYIKVNHCLWSHPCCKRSEVRVVPSELPNGCGNFCSHHIGNRNYQFAHVTERLLFGAKAVCDEGPHRIKAISAGEMAAPVDGIRNTTYRSGKVVPDSIQNRLLSALLLLRKLGLLSSSFISLSSSIHISLRFLTSVASDINPGGYRGSEYRAAGGNPARLRFGGKRKPPVVNATPRPTVVLHQGYLRSYTTHRCAP